MQSHAGHQSGRSDSNSGRSGSRFGHSGSNSGRSGSHFGRSGSNSGRSESNSGRSRLNPRWSGSNSGRHGSPHSRSDRQRPVSTDRRGHSRERPTSESPSGTSASGQPRSGAQSSFHQTAEDNRWLLRSAGTCHTCGQPGHLARDCPLSECYRCGCKGHIARFCQRRSSVRPREDQKRRFTPQGFKRSASGNNFRPRTQEGLQRSGPASLRPRSQRPHTPRTPGRSRQSSSPHTGRQGSHGRKLPGKGTCHKCGKEGHWQDACPNTTKI